jgi:hypothetical protein
MACQQAKPVEAIRIAQRGYHQRPAITTPSAAMLGD